MESINSGEINANSKEVSISFAKVEREPGTERTLVLKYPNRYIPQFMEDLADIPLVLHMGNQKKTVAIEVANIKSYTLRVKMKSGADIEGVDLHSVSNLRLVKRVENLIRDTDSWNEFLSPSLERLMFDDPNYIENNVFSTGHQSVNVYGLPEKRYEVRTEDNAVDIQIHRDAPKAVILSTEQPSTSSGGVSDVPTI